MKKLTILMLATAVLAFGCKKKEEGGDDKAESAAKKEEKKEQPKAADADKSGDQAKDEKAPDAKDKKLTRYVIERDIPGLTKATQEQTVAGIKKSNDVIAELGNDKIKWLHSHVTDDKMFCVYDAENEDILKAHAEKSGFPASKISVLKGDIKPSMAGGPENELATPEGMTTYVIEREMPGVGKMEQEAAMGAVKASNETVSKLGDDKIKWVNSYVTDDKLYCVYHAKEEGLVKKHAETLKMPANKILTLRATVDPTTGQK